MSVIGSRRRFLRRLAVLVVCCGLLTVPLAGVVGAASTSQSDDEDGPVSPGETYEGNTSTDDVDRYTFTAEEGEYIRVTTRTAHAEEITAVLLSPTGEELATQELYVESIAFGTRAWSGGEYTLEFRASETLGERGGTYRFTPEVVPPGANEPDDSREQATSLPMGTTETGRLGMATVDYWTFTPEAGSIEVRIEGEPGIGQRFDAMVDGPGEDTFATGEMGCGPTSGCTTLELPIEDAEPGRYYVQVAPAGIAGFIDYQITVVQTATRSAGGGDDSGSERHRLELTGDGSRVSYSFEVTGEVYPTDTLNTEEDITGRRARGVVVEGSDVFEYTGEIASFSSSADLAIEVDGEAVSAAELSGEEPAERHTVTLGSADGSAVDYSFEVTGDLTATESLNTEERIDGSRAVGRVIEGTDTFEYTGELTSLDANGPITVRIDGDAVDPTTLGYTPPESDSPSGENDHADGAEDGDGSTGGGTDDSREAGGSADESNGGDGTAGDQSNAGGDDDGASSGESASDDDDGGEGQTANAGQQDGDGGPSMPTDDSSTTEGSGSASTIGQERSLNDAELDRGDDGGSSSQFGDGFGVGVALAALLALVGGGAYLGRQS